MNSATLVRPGLRMGMRPERRELSDESRLDHTCARWLAHKVKPELRSFQRFSQCLRQIEAVEKRIIKLDLAKRNSAMLEMRQSLRRLDRSQSDMATAFALIRYGLLQTVGVRLYDEQLYAGWCLQEGHFVEMQTGEGKTLTAALPAIAMAMAGVPVHIITSNEYLAQRDLELLEPLYTWFGLKSGAVLSTQDDIQKQNGYSCDITYCTHQQVVFDYLRDTRLLGCQRAGLVSQIHELLEEDAPITLQRGLCFAIVDEADSVLIDDARTPLILAEPVGNDDGLVAEAAVALAIARTLNLAEHFDIDNRGKCASLTEPGLACVAQQTAHLAGTWKLPRYRDERVKQALSALHLFHKDSDYLVIDGTVVLIDQSTGRATPQRRLQHGMHRMLEVKERCRISDETAAVSAISFQKFFTRYHLLCGMSGTLRESRHELRRVYGPRTIVVPTVKNCRRISLPRSVLATREAQISVVVEQAEQYRLSKRAVLIGTRTVSLADKVSEALMQAGIEHAVLNARQDADEARTVAKAGIAGCVTVATNMAGRGTDIQCSNVVLTHGGLHVINLELNDAVRIDRQLHGRAARQGEPGSCQDILSLDDELLNGQLNSMLRRVLLWSIGDPRSRFRQCVVNLLVRYTQRGVESRYRRLRLAVRDGQTQIQRMLAIGGYGE